MNLIIKRFLIGILIVGIFLFGSLFTLNKVSAAEMSIRDFINFLILIDVIPVDKIVAVNTFLANLDSISPGASSFTTSNSTNLSCVNLTQNLEYRLSDLYTDGQVTKLQNFLVDKHFLNVTPSGYFGPDTLTATKAFQFSNGIPGTGYVGPITRMKIKDLTCSSGSSSSLLTNSTGVSFEALSPIIKVRHRSSSSSNSDVATSTYTLTYDGNTNTGGTAPTDNSSPYEEGATVTVLDNTGSLIKTGYTFTGWNTAANGSGTARATSSTFAMPAANTTLYAVFTANNNTITFNTNGGDGGATAPQTLATGATANLTANGFTRTGYTFSGWATTTDGVVGYADGASYTMGTGDVTLYAIWTVNPIYYALLYTANANGSLTGSTTQVVLAGGNGSEVTAVPSAGYHFTAWSDLVETASRTDLAIADDLAVSASFVINTYTITFDKNGGDVDANPTTKTANHGGNVGTLPTAPTREGYTFTAWNTVANGSGSTFDATTVVTAHDTVYAIWSADAPTYTLTYNGNTNTGGTAPTDNSSPYEEGATVTVLDNTGSLVKTGYTFTGWNTAANGSGTARATSSTFAMPAANTTLYAVFTANNNTITFNTNGGDGGSTAPQTLATGATANLTANGFTRTGYTFSGWATTTDGVVGYADEASYTMGTGDVTLYAIWSAEASIFSCDPDTSACNTDCNLIFNSNMIDSPSDEWGLYSGYCADYVIPSLNVYPDAFCDTNGVPGSVFGSCALFSDGMMMTMYCPSTVRMGRDVTTSDCICKEVTPCMMIETQEMCTPQGCSWNGDYCDGWYETSCSYDYNFYFDFSSTYF